MERKRTFDAVPSLTIELDPEAYQLRKERGLYRLNVVVNPMYRFAIFYVLAAVVQLHNRFVLHSNVAAGTTATMLVVFGAYPIVAWIAARFLYRRWPSVSTLLLVADTVMLVLAVHFSGDERSALFFVPLFRVVDQVQVSMRRALAFGAIAVGGYVTLIVSVDAVVGRPIYWPAEAVKIALLALTVVYLAATARTADAVRKRMSEAIRLARESVDEVRASKRDLEEAVRENDLILGSVGEGIVGLDTSGIIRFVNARAARVIGRDPSDLIGRDGHEMTAHLGDDGEPCNGRECSLARALRSGTEIIGEHPGIIAPDGRVVPVEYACSPILENGIHRGAVFSFRDITERKRIEAELVAAKERAEAADEAKGRFLRNMSHELRTPLNAIIGYAEIVEDEARDEGLVDVVGDVARIRSAARHLLAIIEDVLDIASLERGHSDLDLQPVDLASLVAEIESAERDYFTGRGNELVASCEPLRVMADPVKTRRAILHLLNNANKFTENGRVHLRVARDDGGIAIEVADTGVGISVEKQGLLFRTFGQADDSSTRRHDGMGLGLAIVARLVELMGGTIDLESEPGRGSTFRLRLPLEETVA